jgi:4-amino-4-deoxy-L-arabinose transferase-like glycosyltransferase
MRSRRTILIALLLLIVGLGFVLRFYKLGVVPNSLNWDEVSWGYTAYSVLETGRDEYGRFLPTSFEALGDFKQPLYVYSQLIPIKLFDLNALSVRLPSALFGTLSIIFVFLLSTEIFRKSEREFEISVLSAFLYAISPWSIQFSRVAYEANLALFFIISGSWLFLYGLSKQKNILLFLSVLLIGLSTYTYHSAKIFSPLLLVLLLGYSFFFEGLAKKLALFLFLAFIAVNSIWLIDTRTTERGRSVLFVHDQYLLKDPAREAIYDRGQGDRIGPLFHNRRVVFVNQYIENYISHFNPVWLFMKGDQDRHHAPHTGILYVVNLPFILLGIYLLLSNKEKRFSILFAWLLLAPLASALATGAPNASRSMVMLPTWQIFAAVGWVGLWGFLTKRNLRPLILLPVILLVLNLSYFVHQYFIHTNTEFQISWQHGYKEAINLTSKYRDSDRKVVFSKDFEKPYIFYLFYTKYDPKKYFGEKTFERLGDKCFQIENNYFGECKEFLENGDIYVALNSEELDENLLETVTYSHGQAAVRIYEISQ